MKLFDASRSDWSSAKNVRMIKDAEKYAAEGGQALHVWDPGPEGWPGAPNVFLRNRPWAHLFDNDEVRLVKTAKKLGVRVVVVDGQGRKGQHIDLCGRPLERAITLCDKEEEPKPKTKMQRRPCRLRNATP